MRFLLLLVFLTYPVLAQQPVRGWYDIPPKEYPEFAPRYIKVPKEDNGLTQLYEAVESIMEIPGIEDEVRTQKYSKKNAEKWLKVVEEKQGAFDKLSKAVLSKHLQPEEIKDIHDSSGSLISTVKASRLLTWLTKLHLATGNKELFAKHLLLNHGLSSKLLKTDGSLISYLVSTACYNAHLSEIYLSTSNQQIDSRDIQTIEKLFIKDLVIRDSAKRSLNFEFRIAERAFTQIYQGTLSAEFAELDESFVKRKLKHLILKIVFQPNKSIRILASHTGLLQKMIDTPAFKRKSLIKQYEVKVTDKIKRKIDLFSFNQVGRRLLQMMSPIIKKNAISITDQTSLKSSFVRTIIALKSYHLKYNELPESLESLTPKFIAELPTDPYSGKALRYNKDLKILWSVGADLENENGHDPKLLDKLNPFGGLDDQSDPTVLIPF
ncbi:hypothetical protein Rhal01_00977 [Rubritalea halochordaticola]|uniref:Uncharacterized protein n=1 Tax=Rubritalea halochordaticola TaxID=714537 RepID=A0ABP9UWH0_9BACT